MKPQKFNTMKFLHELFSTWKFPDLTTKIYCTHEGKQVETSLHK